MQRDRFKLATNYQLCLTISPFPMPSRRHQNICCDNLTPKSKDRALKSLDAASRVVLLMACNSQIRGDWKTNTTVDLRQKRRFLAQLLRRRRAMTRAVQQSLISCFS